MTRDSAPGTPPPGTPELSLKAQDFIRLRSRLDAMPAVSRDDRVRELRERIENGTYVVDAERIAEAMLRDGAVSAALGTPQSG